MNNQAFTSESGTDEAESRYRPSGHAIVDAVARFDLQLKDQNGKDRGNFIPAAWWRTITTGTGRKTKPDFPVILVLSQILFWFRPRNRYLGEDKWQWEKRFDADLPQISRRHFANRFNLTMRVVSRCLAKLVQLGVIRTHLRTRTTAEGQKLHNCLYIELVVEKLEELFTIAPSEDDDTGGPTKGVGTQRAEPLEQAVTPSGLSGHTVVPLGAHAPVSGVIPSGLSGETNTSTKTQGSTPGQTSKAATTTLRRPCAVNDVVVAPSQQSGAAAPEPPPRGRLDPRLDKANACNHNKSPVRHIPVQSSTQDRNRYQDVPDERTRTSPIRKPNAQPVAPMAQSAASGGLARASKHPASAAAPPAQRASTVVTASNQKQDDQTVELDLVVTPDNRTEKLVQFYEQAFCSKFGKKLKVTGEDLDMVRQYFNGSDWQVPETALVLLKSWELIGKKDGDFSYGACQHPDKLRTLFKHFDDVCDYVNGNRFGDWSVHKVLGKLANLSHFSLEQLEASFRSELESESAGDDEQGEDTWTRIQPEVEAELKRKEEMELKITDAQKKFWLRWVKEYCVFHGELPRDWKSDIYAVSNVPALSDEQLHDQLFKFVGEMFRAYRKWDLNRDKKAGFTGGPTWPILSNIFRTDEFRNLAELT